jgi:hypothetical protein
MLVVALINRFHFAPRVSDEPGALQPLGYTVALRAKLGARGACSGERFSAPGRRRSTPIEAGSEATLVRVMAAFTSV